MLIVLCWEVGDSGSSTCSLRESLETISSAPWTNALTTDPGVGKPWYVDQVQPIETLDLTYRGEASVVFGSGGFPKQQYQWVPSTHRPMYLRPKLGHTILQPEQVNNHCIISNWAKK